MPTNLYHIVAVYETMNVAGEWLLRCIEGDVESTSMPAALLLFSAKYDLEPIVSAHIVQSDNSQIEKTDEIANDENNNTTYTSMKGES